MLRRFCTTSSLKQTVGSFLNFDLINKSGVIRAKDLSNNYVLCVNTASLCGFTPQLKELQILHERFESRGLRILAIPCNDFGSQEPHEENVIEEFYRNTYGVSYRITSKQRVIGDNSHEFYKALEKEYDIQILPSWNFGKILLDRQGNLAAVFSSDTSPLSPFLVDILEEDLDKEEIDKEEIDKEEVDKEEVDKEEVDKEEVDKEEVEKEKVEKEEEKEEK